MTADPRIGNRELIDATPGVKRYRLHGLRIGFADVHGEDRRCACGFALWAWQATCPRCGKTAER